MSNYSPVYKSIWTSQKFMKLDAVEKLIFLYLLSNERAQKTGVYVILPKQISCDCDIEVAEVKKALKKFHHLQLINYWEEDNLILIHRYFKYTKGTIKNRTILQKTIARQKELLNHKEAWDLFDMEYSNELAIINDLLMDD